jgi:hypothetical protein
MVYFLLVIVVLLVRALMALFTGDFETIQRIAGSRSGMQEVQEELENLGARPAPTGGDR